MRVIVDTIKLSLERRRQHHDGQRRQRPWIPVLFGLVVLGGGLLVKAAVGSDDPAPDAAPSRSPSTAAQLIADPSAPSRPSAESSRAVPSRTGSVARAAAGAEIAGRADIEVSPAAAAVLREGTVDGRVLIVLASLASADLLTAVGVPGGGSADGATLEMGVVDVDRVLAWLDGQRRLRPDRVEVRRVGSVSYLLFSYLTAEPAELFPS